ncbi:major capsid protein [Aerococcus urinaeequi]
MPLLETAVTAQNVVGYFEATTTQDDSLGARLFPAEKQLGLTLEYIKGSGNKAVQLRASAFDTRTTFRDRMPIELNSERMPFFKEGYLVKESDRQQLAILEMTGNQALIDTVLTKIFSDSANLILAAQARVQAMRMQVLATGKLAIDSNGVKQEYDYSVPEENKGTVTNNWSDAENATPLKDISEAVDKMADNGVAIEGVVMNNRTFGYLRDAKATKRQIKGNAQNATPDVTNRELTEFLSNEYGLTVEIVKATNVGDDGQAHKIFPDGHVTLIPNQTLGRTVFGTSPAEMDLTSRQDVDVSVVNTGVAVVTTMTTDPVNKQTRAEMVTLPSFEGANLVYLLTTEAEANEPIGEDTEGETGA